ncbi:MAG: D-aminoacylase [Longimicrobiales bacterium]|nr:D-aminoacylase [Longimicrobiales bacterium]
MKRTCALLLVTALASGACADPGPESGGVSEAAGAFDVLIRGGKVVDGSGNPWVYADVGIRAGRIAAIGRLDGAAAQTTIDATGKVVSPGFVDMHTHSDYTLLVDGRAESKIRQGVTTEVLGEGTSPGPVQGETEASTREALARYGLGEPDWRTLGEYFSRLERQGTATNVASYVSAGQVRVSVMGYVDRPPSPEELEEMRRLVAEGMEDGAMGLVASLEGPYEVTTTEELIELSKVVSRYGGIYATHLRGQAETLFEAIGEAIDIGEQGGVPVEIFHIKVAGKANWGNMPQALALIEAARTRGLDVTADQYPYIAGAHPFLPLLPTWALEGGVEKTMERLRDPDLRARMKRDIEQGLEGWRGNYVQQTGGWGGVMVSDTRTEGNKNLVGKTLADNGTMRGMDPAEAFFDLMLEENGQVMGILFHMNEEDVRTAMHVPWVSMGSDGSALAVEGPLSEGQPHPRNFGTFPRVLGRYVRELRILTLEDAIRKMTSSGAQRLALRDRGLLREGYWADVVVFDPERVIDKATFEDPKQYPEGIDYVLVNGTVVLENGTHTGALPGRPLRGPGYRGGAAPARVGGGG